MTVLYVARHGDADYPVHGVLTDAGGWLTDKGKAQVDALAGSLRDKGIRGVYSSTMERAIESAERVAAVLGVPHSPVDGLQEYAAGDWVGRSYHDPEVQALLDAWMSGDLDAAPPGGESGHQLLDRFKVGMQEVQDATGDERSLTFTHGGVMSLCVPRLSQNVRNDLARESFVPNAVPATIEVTADVWRVLSWPGATDKAVV